MNSSQTAERDKHIVQKEKGKEAADKKGGAKKIDIKIGDKVLVQNVVFPNKITPTFDQPEFALLERHKNIVKIAGGGRTLMRNSALSVAASDVSVALAPESGTLQTIPANFQDAKGD